MKRKCAGEEDGGCSGAPPAYTKMLPTKIERVVINTLELMAKRRDAGDLGNRVQ